MDHQHTFEAARGLLKSQLRLTVYAAKLEVSPSGTWESLKGVEEGFRGVYAEGWKEALGAWNLSDASQVDKLRDLVMEALTQARSSAAQHFHEFGVPDEWTEERIQSWVDEFDVDKFLGTA